MSVGKTLAIVFVALVAVVVMGIASVVGFHNSEVGLRNAFNNKIEANTTDYDNMWKTISQVAQVPAQYRDDFKAVFVEYAEARNSGENSGSLMQWVQEAVPEDFDSSLYAKIQTVVEAQRGSWTTRQKELVALKQEHDNLIKKFPGVVYAGILGRTELELKLVTSTRTHNAFETGTDDDVSLTGK